MLQAFVIVLREGFEAFLIVAIIFAYFRKTGQLQYLPAVRWGVAFSVIPSGLLGLFLYRGASQPLWEGVTGVISAVLITWFVIHMWKTAPHLKQEMETKLKQSIAAPTHRGAALGVFAFTAFMISREGMETALLLIQIHEPRIVTGIALGILAAGSMAFLWGKLGHRINLKLFFQVTALFLLLFVAQVLLYSFHEFCEAGIFPHSEALHVATEPYSSEGIYGRWVSLGMVIICALWMLGSELIHRFKSHEGR